MSTRWARVAGIDPGSVFTGIVCLQVETGMRASVAAARWIGSVRVLGAARADGRRTDAERDVILFQRILAVLRTFQPEQVAIEDPWDVGIARLQRRGTAHNVGTAYGLALAAAVSVNARVWSYPVTTAPARQSRGERPAITPAHTGWMPTFQKKGTGALLTQDRDITLRDLDRLSRTLRMQPANGILPAVTQGTLSVLSEDERMALGVLRFHLSRQPL